MNHDHDAAAIANLEPASAPRTRRPNGQGGIEFNKPTGRWRGHYYDAAGEHARLPWCATRTDAEQQLQAALEMLANGNALSVGGTTLRLWGETFLERRELEGHRAAQHDNSRWSLYIATADFIDWPLESIQRRDVKRWLAALKVRKTHGRGTPPAKRTANAKKRVSAPKRVLSWQTQKHAVVLLRKAFDMAIEDENVSDNFANPCIGIVLKRPPTTEKPVNFLTRDEILAVQKHADPLFLPLIEFAIATGLRQGEMRALRDADVHLHGVDVPYITVRYGGTPTKPTKSGHPRDVPLLPMAQRALTGWYELRKTWCKENDKRLAFPAQYGGYRSAGKILGRKHQEIWTTLLRRAGVTRHLVWHDLRHTCATALLGGFFGQKWRLEEIQQMLGHADLETTQRYAHALRETLHDVARSTTGDLVATDRKSRR